MMPSGALIFAGQLRGEDSFGMMASPRELALPNAPQKRGIIELAASEIQEPPLIQPNIGKNNQNKIKTKSSCLRISK